MVVSGDRYRSRITPYYWLEPEAELVVHALKQALEARPQAKSPHTLFHSDRGSQYGSSAFRSVLADAGMRQIMSARANPYDNAWSESFIGTLKREMLQGGCFEDTTDAELEFFEYIDGYYNNQRKHSAIGYLTPNQFDAQQSNLNETTKIRESLKPWSKIQLHLTPLPTCEAISSWRGRDALAPLGVHW